MCNLHRYVFLTVLVIAVLVNPGRSYATWPAGQLTHTQTVTVGNCGNVIGAMSTTTYSNWNYKDSSGVNHPFAGSTQQIFKNPGACFDNGPDTTSLVATNGAYTLNATGSVGSVTISENYFPSYHILSLLYDPPGNQSTVGILDTTFNGVTNTIGNTFTSGTTFTFTNGFRVFGFGSTDSTSVGFTNSTGTSSAFTDTVTNGHSLTLKSTRNPIDHTNDLFWIWLNPEVTVTQTGAMAATYTVAPPAGRVMDAVRVSVAQLQNPSTIPLPILEPITIDGIVYPGLCNICAHPLPASQCTQANACGCVAQDFAQILATDPLLALTSNSPPTQIDPNRYFPLSPAPSPFPLLEAGSTEGFMLTDQMQTQHTQTESTSYSTSYSNELDANVKDTIIDFTLSIRETNTFTWMQSVSLTNTSGTSHQMNLTLGTSTSGCAEAVDIYEDYDYHTFVSVPSAAPPPPCTTN